MDLGADIVKNWASEVVGNISNPYYIVKAIYQNLTDTLVYNKNVWGDGNPLASKILEARSGVCRHFALVFSSLCLVYKIPVRLVLGMAGFDFEYDFKENHMWNDVYLPNYWWVSMDVTWNNFAFIPSKKLIYFLPDIRNVGEVRNTSNTSEPWYIDFKRDSRSGIREIIDYIEIVFSDVIQSNAEIRDDFLYIESNYQNMDFNSILINIADLEVKLFTYRVDYILFSLAICIIYVIILT